MEKREAHYLLRKTSSYRLRRKHWTINFLVSVLTPFVGLVFIPCCVFFAAIRGAIEGALEEARSLGSLNIPFLPNWAKRDEWLDMQIKEAQEALREE